MGSRTFDVLGAAQRFTPSRGSTRSAEGISDGGCDLLALLGE